METIAILGAGGSMGTRARRALAPDDAYRVLCVESDAARHESIVGEGLELMDGRRAAAEADVVLFTVPDRLVGAIADELVPLVRPRTMIVCLDPAAPLAGVLPERDDVTYFVTHPAHPPVFNDETDMAARRDHFGSGLAKQAIVNALMQGPESDYERGERIARKLFGPILRSHRISVEQMAILEPALVETLAATCLKVIRDGLDEAVARGVPQQAARDFLMGHLNVELAILFNEIDWDFSDGAKHAMREAEGRLFQPDWRKIFEPEEVHRSVASIAHADTARG